MAKAATTAVALAETISVPMDGNGPCRAYITGADEIDKRGRSLWLCYFAIDGGLKREMVPSKPLIWREASRLAEALNRRSGLLIEQQQPDKEEAVA